MSLLFCPFFLAFFRLCIVSFIKRTRSSLNQESREEPG